MHTSSKLFEHLASAYRNHKSKSDCFMLHGYSRDIFVEFGWKDLNSEDFVVDFGGLKDIKRWLEDNFDHTVVLQADDPMARTFREFSKNGDCKLTLIPCVSAEGWACYIAKYMDQKIREITKGRAWVISLEVRENSKNAAKYINSSAIDGTLNELFDFDDLIDLAFDMEGLENGSK